jgi:hypothetical protein
MKSGEDITARNYVRKSDLIRIAEGNALNGEQHRDGF